VNPLLRPEFPNGISSGADKTCTCGGLRIIFVRDGGQHLILFGEVNPKATSP